MTRYLECLSNQRPFPFDVDDNNRTLYSCNYRFTAAAPVSDFEGEIVKLLVDAGLSTGISIGGNTLVGRSGTTPTGDGPFIRLIDTGGIPPLEAHDNSKRERLSMQIVVTAKSHKVARDRSLAIWRLLDGKRSFTVTAA